MERSRNPRRNQISPPANRRGSETTGTAARSGPRPSFRWDGESSIAVSAVEPQERNPERVNVFVDGAFAFSLGALLAHEARLREGVVLTPEALRDLLRRDDVGKAVEACVRLLSYRPRTEAELLKRLTQKGYEPETASEAVAWVRDRGYVDDADFARFWVRNRDQFKPMGARRLRYELAQKGVDRETATSVLQETLPEQEDDAAMRAARSKLRTYSRLDYETFRRRLGGFLARQGFDYETSARVVKALWQETSGTETYEEEPSEW